MSNGHLCWHGAESRLAELAEDSSHAGLISCGLVSSEFEASFVIDGFEHVECQVSDDGHVGDAVFGSGSRGILAEGYIERPRQTVLDRPTRSHSLGKLVRRH